LINEARVILSVLAKDLAQRTTNHADPSEYLRMTTPRRVSSFAMAVVLLLATAALAAEREHEFSYKPEGNPQRVSVAGEFNNWSSDANPMIRGGDGVWRTKVSLADGIYHYKFVVNGDQWKNDPAADKSLDRRLTATAALTAARSSGPDARKLPAAATESYRSARRRLRRT
jgi:1,4-alpha-glucan branching enzyme